MKTILVHYSGSDKKYPFNVGNEDIRVGDVVTSASCEKAMIIDIILAEEYRFWNTKTGDLTNTCASVYCDPIKTIILNCEE